MPDRMQKIEEHDQLISLSLLLLDPETGDPMHIVSSMTPNDDGSYSFFCQNIKTGARWKHTIRTEEAA